MAWQLTRQFDNFGQVDNPAGVCESAVCLWQRRIRERIGAFNWGSSAGDWVPSAADANTLYGEFDANPSPYVFTFQSYLAQHVYNAARLRVGDVNHAAPMVPCSHYSGDPNNQWLQTLTAMVQGDTLFLSLTGPAVVSHAMGVYRGTDYIFVFDPNVGLYKGTGWARVKCFTQVNHNLAAAAQYLQGQCGIHHWTANTYLGIHLR